MDINLHQSLPVITYTQICNFRSIAVPQILFENKLYLTCCSNIVGFTTKCANNFIKLSTQRVHFLFICSEIHAKLSDKVAGDNLVRCIHSAAIYSALA